MVLETDKKWWFWDVEDADLCKDFCGYDLILDPKHKDIILEADWHQWRKRQRRRKGLLGEGRFWVLCVNRAFKCCNDRDFGWIKL